MSETKLSDLTLALYKTTEVLTYIVYQPTDTNIINIRQLFFPVLIRTKYEELTSIHNLSGVNIPTDRYKHIYKKGAYSITPVVSLYDDKINRYATRTEVHRAEGKHEGKRNDHALYKTADTACKNFIMGVVDKTWYKELEDLDTFYKNITALKLLDHLT